MKVRLSERRRVRNQITTKGLALLKGCCLHIYFVNSGRFGCFGCNVKSVHLNKAEPLIHLGFFLGLPTAHAPTDYQVSDGRPSGPCDQLGGDDHSSLT